MEVTTSQKVVVSLFQADISFSPLLPSVFVQTDITTKKASPSMWHSVRDVNFVDDAVNFGTGVRPGT